jgi:regulator of sirC expression with transglutaminase-like and TPR domain
MSPDWMKGASALESTGQIDKGFSQIASLPDDRIDLARGALLIAKAAYPDLDEPFYLGLLNRLAASLTHHITAKMDAVDIITRINHILFEEEKLRGNRQNYFDPDNSFLNRAEIRTDDDCRAIIRNQVGETGASDPNGLEPVGRKKFLTRMLRNLKLVYAQANNDVMPYRMVHWIPRLQPEAPVELRERAMIYEAIGVPARAIKDWQLVIANTSDLENEKSIRARIDCLQKQKPRIH